MGVETRVVSCLCPHTTVGFDVQYCLVDGADKCVVENRYCNEKVLRYCHVVKYWRGAFKQNALPGYPPKPVVVGLAGYWWGLSCAKVAPAPHRSPNYIDRYRHEVSSPDQIRPLYFKWSAVRAGYCKVGPPYIRNTPG